MNLMRKYIILLIMLSGLNMTARGQEMPEIDLSGLPQATTAASLRYWFDTIDDGTNIKTTTTLSGATTIDASALQEGIHTVHYQIIDNKGTACITNSQLFIKLDAKVNAKAKKLRYWFDTDAANATITETLTGGTIIASALTEGIHTLHYQIIDNLGYDGITVSKIFIKLDAKVNAKTNKLRYWFDTDNASVVETALAEGIQTIDASKLPEGIHTLHYQIIDDQGNVDIPVSAMFFKLSSKVAIAATAVQYWFDENDDIIKETTLDLKSLTMTINVGGIGQGEHVLHYQLKLDDGTLSPAASATFETTQTLEGDANNDKKVNVADIVVIQIFLDDKTYEKIHVANADVTKDGVVDKNDVEAVKDIIMTPKEE